MSISLQPPRTGINSSATPTKPFQGWESGNWVPYSELYCHLVWATKDRSPLLVGERATVAERSIRASCREKGAVVLALCLMPDHVHLAVSMPPRISVSDLMHLVKGSSSHLLDRDRSTPADVPFAWQSEYGAISFGKRSLSQIVAYIVNQREHHASNDLLPTFEQTERPYTKPDAADEA